MEFIELAQQAVDAVIRPPRREYDLYTFPILLRTDDGYQYHRYPINFINERNQKIVGSIYKYISTDIMSGGPCVIYLHGNASSQLEGLFLIPNLCQYGITVYLYDAAGCGQSEGDYISLGFYESQDMRFLISNLEINFNLGPFILWGRSMGAATAVMTRHPSVSGIIVDSTFSKLYDLILSITATMKFPSILGKIAVFFLNMSVKDCADFDMNDVSPLKSAKMICNPPLVIGHAANDDFIPFNQAKEIFENYSNMDKVFVELSNGHNGSRSHEWYKICFSFIFEKLNLRPLGFVIRKFKGMLSRAHFSDAMDMIQYQEHDIPGQSVIVDNSVVESIMHCTFFSSSGEGEAEEEGF